MKPLAFCILSLLYFFYLFVAALCFAALFPIFFLSSIVVKKLKVDETLRCFNYWFGLFLVTLAWPLIRIQVTGKNNIPSGKPCVIIVNHRSTSDIVMTPLFVTLNTIVFVRSWPLRLPVIRWFMQGAGYVDIEKTSLDDFFETAGSDFSKRGISFLFFPEGHRTRDGKLQRFKSGAFVVATEYDMPVIPVCMTGTEKFLPLNRMYLTPATIKIEVMEPVYPSTFPQEKRAFKLKKFVESLYREYLNE